MTTSRTRREPPRFRRVEVVAVTPRSPRLQRVTLAGPDLEGFDVGLPAASVRLLLPASHADDVVIPTWTGNEFLYDDASRPVIRTLTPLAFDASANRLEVEIVRHGSGPLSSWGGAARLGDQAALSGPGRGYEVDPSTRHLLLAGDESALPAIGVLLRELPVHIELQVLIEVAEPVAELDLPPHPLAEVRWCTRAAGGAPGGELVAATKATVLAPEAWVWAAGEAVAMQRIRRHLFDDRGLPRARAVVRGYWKGGRQDDDGD